MWLCRCWVSTGHAVVREGRVLLCPQAYHPLPRRYGRGCVFNAFKANNKRILHGSTIDNIEELIKWGIMVTHGPTEELTSKGRSCTKREMPY